MKPSSKILAQAREYVSKGWCQRAWREPCIDRDDKYCATGAIYLAYNKWRAEDWKENLDSTEIEIEVFDRMHKSIGSVMLMSWNDDPKRTQEDVVNAFTKAIGDDI